jgi:hypothetical protein
MKTNKLCDIIDTTNEPNILQKMEWGGNQNTTTMKTNLTRDEILNISNNMIRYGGGFASNLGKALLVADAENTNKILTAFPELISQYKKLTK